MASEHAHIPAHSRRAITLVELVIAMGIVGVTVGATAAMLYAGGRSLPSANDSIEEAIEVSDALRTVIDLTRPARTIEVLDTSRYRFTLRDPQTDEEAVVIIRPRGIGNTQLDSSVGGAPWETIITGIRGFTVEPILRNATTVGLRFTIVMPSGVELSNATDLPNIIGATP